MAVNRRHPWYHLCQGKGSSRNKAVTCSAGSQHTPRCKADILHCPQSCRDSGTMLHRGGKKGSVQQKREAHTVGRAGSYSTEPSKVDKYKFTGRQTSPKFCCLQVKVTHCVLWHICCWPFGFCHALPPVFTMYIHTFQSPCLPLAQWSNSSSPTNIHWTNAVVQDSWLSQWHKFHWL